MIFVGVDGGGTTTRCVASDAAGSRLGEANGPASNIHETGVTAASELILELVRRALHQAGLTHARPRISAAACIAGIDSEDSRVQTRASLEAGTPLAAWRVENDTLAAWTAAFPREDRGIVAIAGTGAIALARNEAREARAGGWGAKLGDPGSGYDLGRAALIAVLSSADGAGHSTTLTPAILDHLGLTRAHQIIDHVHLAMRHTDIAALAPMVLAHAERGDPVAAGITGKVARSIIGIALAAGTAAGLGESEPAPFALLGGLARNHYFKTVIQATIAENDEALAWRPVYNEPVIGAVQLAIQGPGFESHSRNKPPRRTQWSAQQVDNRPRQAPEPGAGVASEMAE